MAREESTFWYEDWCPNWVFLKERTKKLHENNSFRTRPRAKSRRREPENEK